MAAPPTSSRARRKIAIFGGGMAGLAAAWELTSRADWSAHYDVTLYQPGWRLGGKLATGRGVRERIEEHGIHVLQGWYHETFRLMRDVYDERRRLRLAPDGPFQSWRDALAPDHGTFMMDRSPVKGTLELFPTSFPPNDLVPGEGAPLRHFESLLVMMRLTVRWSIDALVSLEKGPPRLDPRVQSIIATPLRRIEAMLAHPTVGPAFFRTLNAALEGSLPIFTRAAARVGDNPRLHYVVTMLEMGRVIVKGLLADALAPGESELNLDRIDHWDYRDWLRHHGASEAVLKSAPVRFNYNITFSHPSPSASESGRISAATVIGFLLRAAGYRGAMFWHFRAGTGDTLIAPIYQVLAHRGVKFRFFHRLERLHAASRGTVDALTVVEQVALDGPDYDPLSHGKGSARLSTWPSRPDRSRVDGLTNDDLLDLESGVGGPAARTHTLRAGVDFDAVVAAAPIAALEPACEDLRRNDPRWADMFRHVATAGSWTMQLWLRAPPDVLGPSPKGLHPGSRAQTTVAEGSVFSWVDMTELLPFEAWHATPGERPRSLLYFVGSLPDPLAVPSGVTAGHVLGLAREWLDAHAATYWPGAVKAGRFDLDLLVDPDGTASSGLDRLRRQWIKLNVDPSERYTLSLPGTARYRLKPGDTGYRNLAIAGDWTDSGLNVGCVEAAVISGLEAARATLHNLGNA